MPLTKSAKKALRTDRSRKVINDLTRYKTKSALKTARLAVLAGGKEAKSKVDTAYRELDIAAKKNVIHQNKASRLKSRLAKKLAKSVEEPKVEAKKPQKQKTSAAKKPSL